MTDVRLVKYDSARRALAACRSVDEVKDWADRAAAMQAYGRMANDKTLQLDAAEIRIRAERRLGEMLAQQKASGGMNRGAAGNPGGQGAPVVRSSEATAQVPTLADAGISKDLSSRAQKLAAVPAAEFEAEVGQWRERSSLEGARVSARLEAAGEKVLRDREAEPDPEGSYEEARAPSIMDQLMASQRQVEFLSRQLQRIGRLFNERDETKIAALVEAFYRKHSAVRT